MENNNEKRIKLTWNKKVISISFLALALFMLLAVSYAYFTATVVGNDQAKDITVEAARMSLKLTGPDQVKLENALPGTEIKSEFTVTNTGTVQTTYNLDMIDVENNFDPASDLVYSITSTNDGGHAENVVAPQTSQTLIRNILIQPGEENAQVYTLTVRFRETGVDQNSNQGKKFTGRVQINNLTDNSLAATILRANPIQDSKNVDLDQASPWNDIGDPNYESEVNGEGLFTSPDNDGTSYYFRGPVTNNNVSFAEKNWKILRINGDGSIRIVFADSSLKTVYNEKYNEAKYLGYTYDNDHDCTKFNPCVSDYDVDNGDFRYNYKNDATADSIVKEELETWYKDNLATSDSQIALSTYCNDTSILSLSSDKYYDYAPNERQKKGINTSLKCSNPTDLNSEVTHDYGGIYKLKIGLITADEIILAGYPKDSSGYVTSSNFLYNIYGYSALTMSPASYVANYNMSLMLLIDGSKPRSIPVNSGSDAGYKTNPVINLKPDVTFTGTGTEDDPYTITNN